MTGRRPSRILTTLHRSRPWFRPESRVWISAREALEILAVWWPDVLLSDVEMPHEDGYLLMAHVTALTGDGRPPIAAVAVTAHSRPEDRRRAIESGFKWHLPKPIEPSELVAVIATLTGGHEMRNETAKKSAHM